MKVYVVCVDQETGVYMAYADGGLRGWGFSEDAAILSIMITQGLINVVKVEPAMTMSEMQKPEAE